MAWYPQLPLALRSTGTNSSSVQLTQNPVYSVVTPLDAKQTSLLLRSDNTTSGMTAQSRDFVIHPGSAVGATRGFSVSM